MSSERATYSVPAGFEAALHLAASLVGRTGSALLRFGAMNQIEPIIKAARRGGILDGDDFAETAIQGRAEWSDVFQRYAELLQRIHERRPDFLRWAVAREVEMAVPDADPPPAPGARDNTVQVFDGGTVREIELPRDRRPRMTECRERLANIDRRLRAHRQRIRAAEYEALDDEGKQAIAEAAEVRDKMRAEGKTAYMRDRDGVSRSMLTGEPEE
jgi:hypothetical protein